MSQHEPLPLVGLTEVAQRAGVQKQAVPVWRLRYEDFPAPVAELRTGAVWWWPDVQAWLARTGRRWDADLSVDDVNNSDRRRGEKSPFDRNNRGGTS